MDTTSPRTSRTDLVALIAIAESVLEQGSSISPAVLWQTIRRLTVVAKEFQAVSHDSDAEGTRSPTAGS